MAYLRFGDDEFGPFEVWRGLYNRFAFENDVGMTTGGLAYEDRFVLRDRGWGGEDVPDSRIEVWLGGTGMSYTGFGSRRFGAESMVTSIFSMRTDGDEPKLLGVIKLEQPVSANSVISWYESRAILRMPVILRGNDLALLSDSGDYIHTYGGNDTVIGGAGPDRINGGAGNDLAYGGGGKDSLIGLGGDDRLFGGAGNDVLSGVQGNDTLRGGAGNDLLLGSHGDDFLSGGDGRDQLFGGDGTDILVGGAGADTFIPRIGNWDGDTRDTIEFSSADGDVIFVKPLDADTSTSQDDPFIFIGTARFSGVAGQLRYDADTRSLLGDFDGDKDADLTIFLSTADVPTEADFVL